jgi:CSLREA domain-containing protein
VLARKSKKVVARRTNNFEALATMAAAMVAALLLPWPAFPAQAQSTITVNTTADEQNSDGKCSLREAIINANNDDQSGSVDCSAGSGADIIAFALAPSSTIWLNSTLPTIENAAGLIIDGEKAPITISGGNEVQVLVVDSGTKFTLKNLRVSDGFTGGAGGGVLTTAHLR